MVSADHFYGIPVVHPRAHRPSTDVLTHRVHGATRHLRHPPTSAAHVLEKQRSSTYTSRCRAVVLSLIARRTSHTIERGGVGCMRTSSRQADASQADLSPVAVARALSCASLDQPARRRRQTAGGGRSCDVRRGSSFSSRGKDHRCRAGSIQKGRRMPQQTRAVVHQIFEIDGGRGGGYP